MSHKAITFLYELGLDVKFVRLALAHSLEFHLTPVELWLLIKLHGHQDGVYAPSVAEIDKAAKAEGYPGMPNIKTLEKAYQGLQAKGYVQRRSVTVPGLGPVWVRGATMVANRFPRGRRLTGPGAPSDAELIEDILKFNSSGKRRDLVAEATARRVQRERVAGNVVDLESRRGAA